MLNRVVLDTNVLVSALLTDGPPSVIVGMVAEGKIIPFYSDAIVGEYWRVLRRPKFGFPPLRVSRLIGDIMRVGIAAEAMPASSIPLPDEDDRLFYDAAKASRAYLVTGNARHFPSEPFVVGPAAFLLMHRQAAAEAS